MIVRREALQVLQGEPREYGGTSADGIRRSGKCCHACATRLWGEPVKFPQILVLRPGTLDDTKWLRPVAHIWVRSAQPWVVIPNDVLTFETQPDDSMALIRAWREREAR